MHDQVSALEVRGIRATYLASTLSPAEMRRRLSLIGDGAFKLVYAAPERLAFPGFRTVGLYDTIDCRVFLSVCREGVAAK